MAGTEDATVVRPATFWLKRERQSNKSTERREEIEENGKMKEAVSNSARFKGADLPVIQSRPWLTINKHIKGAGSL